MQERLLELTRIIEHASPNKDLQALFPQLINNIFSPSFNNGWGLKTVTVDVNKNLYDILLAFLEPQGPMFQLCYKLLSDQQLKYNLPLNVLPVSFCLEAIKIFIEISDFTKYLYIFSSHLFKTFQIALQWCKYICI